MILSEILDAAKSTLRRPEKDDDINRYTVDAIRALHALSKFENDYTEWVILNSAITFDAADGTVGEFTYSRDVRIPEIIVALDSSNARISDIELLSAVEVVRRQNSNVSVENTAYRQGNFKFSFNCSAAPTTFVLGGYTVRPEFSITNDPNTLATTPFTDTTLLGYSSWIMDLYPTAVIDYVIGHVASRLGEKDISNTHLSMFTAVHQPALLELGR